MSDNIRNILSIYVNQNNKDEVDYHSLNQSNVITDLNYLIRQGERRKRLEQWYRHRGAVPLRSETRAKIVREIEDREGEAQVELQLSRKIFYEKGGAHHQEERIEKQQVTLRQEHGEWTVAQISIMVPERYAAPVLPSLVRGEVGHGKAASSRPYLNHQLLGNGGSRSKNIAYRRHDAVLYADRWWDSFNPDFAAFEVDCTNYISQSLFAGGAPINYTGKRESGWWYKGYVGGREAWSYSWSVANALERFLTHNDAGLSAELVNRPQQLELGDVIIYDWDGDGNFGHSTIVTGFDAGGMPLVNAHTIPSKHRYWDYQDSYAWTENTKYRFFHISDRF